MSTVAEPPLSPLIAAQLNHLLQHSSLPVKVDQVWAGSKSSHFSDRFTLSVPFCLDFVKWDVIYNSLQPLAAPDIVFSPEDDDFDPLSEISSRQRLASESSLSEWSNKDPSKLMALIHEIRGLYMDYQRKRVTELNDVRLTFEISTALSREGIETRVISSPDKLEEVKFAVPLLVDMDINKMVPACNWRQQQRIHLQVIFPVSKSYVPSPPAPQIKLVSTSELKVFLAVDDVKLPPWSNGMCMAEYLPGIEDHLKMQVVEAVASIGARRRFIEALAPLFGRPLEADPVFCRRVTLLSSSGAFTFLIHFSIPIVFPKQKPTLILQSSQHFTSQGIPVSSAPITDYPWSPRWDPQEMAERIFDYMVDECLNFKKFCMESVPQLA